MKTINLIKLVFLISAFLILLNFILKTTPCISYSIFNKYIFDGLCAYKHIKYQMHLGPRFPGSEAHSNTISWIDKELSRNDWSTEIQYSELMDHKIYNVIGKRGVGNKWIIIGAHYDTRLFADRNLVKENRSQPVPGANDGASGVAVLLELSRVIPRDVDKEIWLVFFDTEDQGNIPGWDWMLGSRSFVTTLNDIPDAVIIIDMIGDMDLNVYKEHNSDPQLNDEIWNIAYELGYQKYFIPEYKYTILDDHIPFRENGITAIDIIDFDYEYWHTTQDTLDKVSISSLQVVGDILFEWIKNY